jgi:hypothetical protein
VRRASGSARPVAAGRIVISRNGGAIVLCTGENVVLVRCVVVTLRGLKRNARQREQIGALEASIRPPHRRAVSGPATAGTMSAVGGRTDIHHWLPEVYNYCAATIVRPKRFDQDAVNLPDGRRPWKKLGGQGAPMPNPKQTNPHDVVAVLKQAARHSSEQQKRLAVPPRRSLLFRLALQGLIGLLVAGCIGAAAMVLRSPGDAAEQVIARWWEPQLYPISSSATESPVPAATESPVPAQSLSPGQEQLLQSIARGFLAAVEQEIEPLKTSIEQLKTSQEQMVRDNSAVAEQLKAAQEQMVRDNAAVAEQLKATQEQMSRLIAKASEQQLRPKTSAPPPRPIATPTGKPVPKLSSSQARAQPLARVQGRPE